MRMKPTRARARTIANDRFVNALPALTDDMLSAPLALAHHLLAGVHTLALQFSQLGAIDLPPILQPAADVSHIQAVAPLYLASELEAARLIPSVEVLAGLFAEGGLRLADRDAAEELYRFWQNRHNRFSRQEREAFFARLFGFQSATQLAMSDSRNDDFDSQMATLAEGILRMQPDPVFASAPVTDAILVVATSRLAHNLVARSGGITAFAARDIVQTIESALSILKQRSVQVALGAINVWTAVDAVARHYLQEEVNVGAHVRRGRSGMLLLTWVAERVPQLDMRTTDARLPLNQSIYNAAFVWLQANQDLQTSPLGKQSLVGTAREFHFPQSAALAPIQG